MTTNTMTYTLAREIILEGMIENLLDDERFDTYDEAYAAVIEQGTDLAEGIDELLAAHDVAI